MPDQACPLCRGPATFALVDFGTKKRFKCATCKTFVLDSEAERLAAAEPKSNREQISKASAGIAEGFVLFIWVAPDANDASGRSRRKLSWDSKPAGNWQ